MSTSFVEASRRSVCALATVLVVASTACAVRAAPARPTTAAIAAGSAADPGFQGQWDALVSAAAKEGTLTVALGPNPPVEQQVFPAFTRLFGVKVQEVQGTPPNLANKLVQEKSAGVNSSDIFISSCPSVPVAMQGGVYAPLKAQLIIPDVNDASKWTGGKPAYFDPEESYVIRLDRQMRYFFHVNPQKINPGDIRTPQDLLNLQYAGKIGAFDPFLLVGQTIAGVILKLKGTDYLKQLYLGQKVDYANDQRTLSDWLGHSTYPLVIGLPADERASMEAAGLPVARLKVEGLTSDISSVLLVGVVVNASHPNAAKLFVNWMLTRDGMQSFVDADATPGIRTDLDYTKLNPDDVPVAGTQYFDECNHSYVTGEKAQLNDQLKFLLPH